MSVFGELDMIRRYGVRRIRHLITPGRREREREALRVVADAATKLVDTPLGQGISIRQAAKLPPDLRPDIYIAILSGGVRLKPSELDRLMNDSTSVRSEFPEMFTR